MVMQHERVSSPYLEGNFGPVREEVTAEDLKVIGELPEGLEGMFVRNGPNPQFDPIKGYHWFGGDGMLHGVRIKDGNVSYRNRYVQTERWRRENEAGRALWPSTLGGPPDPDNPAGPNPANQGNTALVWHDGRLLALWEGGDPHHIALPGLETCGRYNYGGSLVHAFTAHPKVDEKTGEMMFFGYNMLGMDMRTGQQVPFLQYSVASPQGEIVHTTPIELPVGVMMHDFAVTERYSIFMNLPLVFSMERAMKGENPLYFDRDRPSQFGLLPRRASGDRVRWFESPACYVFHVLNAFEEGDEVVLDGCRMNSVDLGALDSRTALNPETKPLIDRDSEQTLYRWRFNLATGDVKEGRLDDATGDFPRVNDFEVGYKTRFGYVARFDGSGMPQSDGVLKYDLEKETSRFHHHGKQRYGGEAVFVPREGATAEDDGWLMTYVYDHNSGDSEFVVINAQDVESEPVARVPLPQRVPYGFHGAWIPEERVTQSR
jgi:carotenoid cleavage dioxygenase-like enzyme